MALKRRKRPSVLKTKKINKIVSKKLVILFNMVVLALVALALYITYINASSGEQYKRQVLSQAQQQYDSRVIPFQRGDIVDRNGTILATSEKVYNIILDCKVTNSTKLVDRKEKQAYKEPTIEALADILKLDKNEMRKLLESDETKDSQYQIIAKDVSIEVKKEWEDYISTAELDKKDELTNAEKKLYENKINTKGVWFEENYKRTYPMGSIACDVIGFTYADNTADWGIEGYYSKILNGVNGRQFGYFNSDANVEQTIIEPAAGKTVTSTIDTNVQKIVRTALENYDNKQKNGPLGEDSAKNVAAIVMDPNTGEILAMDSNNWYDLNNPRDLSPFYTEDEIAAMDDQTKLNNLFDIWKNYCVTDAYEPGSTFKPMTVAAALELGAISKDDTFTCTGSKTVGGVTIKCSSYPNSHGTQTLGEALENSCNVALMDISEAMGPENFLKYQDMFNFGGTTGIDLPGESTGILHQPDSMGSTELATAAFGQGFTCTMIQEASAFSSVINGGYYYKPHVVKEITSSTGTVENTINPMLVTQTVSKDTSDSIRDYLSGSRTEAGDVAVSRITGYSMGGKSGTAEKIPRAAGKYLVSFAGFAPLDNPEVLVYVIVDEPNASSQADNTYAKNIYKDIMKELMPYLNIFPEDPEAAAQAEAEEVAAQAAEAAQAAQDAQAAEEAAAQAESAEVGVSNESAPAPPVSEGTDENQDAVEGQMNDAITDGVTNDDEDIILGGEDANDPNISVVEGEGAQE